MKLYNIHVWAESEQPRRLLHVACFKFKPSADALIKFLTDVNIATEFTLNDLQDYIKKDSMNDYLGNYRVELAETFTRNSYNGEFEEEKNGYRYSGSLGGNDDMPSRLEGNNHEK